MRSIKQRSMLLLASVSAAVMGVTFIAAYLFASSYFEDQQQTRIDDTTQTLSVVLQEPVFSYDTELTENILDSFVTMPIIQRIEARDHRGKRVGQSASSAPAPDAGEMLKRNVDITWEGKQKIGELTIEYRLDSNDSLLSSTHVLFVLLAAIVLLSLMAVNWFVLSRFVIEPVDKVVDALRNIAKGDGDLTMRLDIKSDDEIGELAKAFNRFISNLQKLITEIASQTHALTDCANQIHGNAGENVKATSTQKSETENVAASLSQLTSSIEEVASNAAMTAEKTNQCNELAISGNRIVQNTVGEIRTLGEKIGTTSEEIAELKSRSDHISSVLVVIKGIAEQTNLLALNAAIEAARAGEQGRSFAVVADEVRALAQRTQASTAEIEEVIKELQSASENTTRTMETTRSSLDQTIEESTRAIDALDTIISNIRTINDMNSQVAASTEEQNQVSSILNSKVADIGTLSATVSQSAMTTGSLSDQLNSISNDIKTRLGRFKI